jgi:tetratricopeptide (TPR) repeat protein
LTLQDVKRLDDADARALFLRHAGGQFAADLALPGLLGALEGHPLSIELLAANALGRDDLRGLAADWRDRRADLLRRGAADDRKTSLRASLELSLAALNPPSPADRIVRLMALLPDGMSEADSRTISSDGEPTREERGAAARLESARLASRPDGRWRLLAPIRETLLADFPPEPADRTRLINLFLARAKLGGKAGTREWGEVSEGLIAEAGNLDAMIGLAVREPALPGGVSSAVSGLAQFHKSTGLASMASLPGAADRFSDVGDVLGEANCLWRLGDIAIYRSDHDGARRRYEEALPLYQKVGAVLGEANCIQGLGDIALRRSDHESARQRYEEALPLYQKVGAVLGEAGCILSLGEIALARSDHEGARQRYEMALPLYQKVGSVLGEASCIFSLGDIALRRSDYQGARRRYREALPLYQKVGSVLGEANCIQGLGDIALARSEHESARRRYEEALHLYQKVGDVLGEANCIQSLGDIALARSEHESARQRYEAALPLFQKVRSLLGEANCITSLGNIALARSDHAGARQRFEAALPLYRRVGSVRGEANCNQGLGDVAERQGKVAVARERWHSALALYTKIRDPYSIGFAHNRLARLTVTPEKAAEHREAAGKAWESIGRQDLIDEYLGKSA